MSCTRGSSYTVKTGDTLYIIAQQQLGEGASPRIRVSVYQRDDHSHYQQAITNYNKALKLAPGNALAYTNRALTYTRLGDQQAAQADRQKAAELSRQPSQ